MEMDPLSTEFVSFDNADVTTDNENEVIKALPLPLTTSVPIKSEDEDKEVKLVEVKKEKIDIDEVTDGNGIDGMDGLECKSSVKEEDIKKTKVKKEKKLKKEKKRKVHLKEVKVKKTRQRRILGNLPEVEQDGIPFYGCAVCDVKFTSLQNLQYHVSVHKDRLTSWDLRVKNQKLRKKIKKEKKKLKKLNIDGIKQENIDVDDVFELPVDLSEYVENLSKDTSNLKIESEYSQNNETISNDNQNLSSNPVIDLPNSSNVNAEAVANENESKGEINKNADESLNLEKIFKCGMCFKQFSLGYYLKLHVRSHTGEKPYHCDQCGISFITASKLGRHRKRTHLSIKFECRICRRPYTRLEFLTRHFNKQHADDKIEGEPYDYNAILPYLKELEEELQRKKEEEESLKKEDKKEDFLFPPIPDLTEPKRITYELLPPVDAGLEEIKKEVVIDVKPEIKVEPPEPPEPVDDADHFVDDEPFIDNQTDDEDYFPKDTWLPPASPKIEVTEVTPLKSKNKKSGDPLHCEICNKKIRSISYMRIHMRTHTGDRPYKCYVCNKGFITASKMNRHVMTHGMEWEDKEEKVAEKSEDTKVKEEVELDEDKDENNPKKKKSRKVRKKRTKCPIPQKHKPEYVNGERVNRRKKKRPHACEFCTKRFLYVEALQIHMRSHSGQQRVYICNFCMVQCDDEDSLKEHEASHCGPRPFLCTVCDRTYKKRESMIYHKRMHESEKKYQCDVCPKSFNAQCKLQRHLMSHRPDKFVVRYECPVCAHIFNTKYHIEMHLSTHEKEGVIALENRGQIIAMVMQNARKIPLESDNPTNLKNLIPTDERSRICNICGEIFNHFYYLEQHLKTHGSKFSVESNNQDSNERKHICKVCNKGFKLSYYLKLHSFTHTKEKPYICQQCGKGFITKGKLKRHLETHAGVKKYQCSICCKFFTRPSYLRIHVRTIHGNQDYNFKHDTSIYDIAMPLADACMSVISQDSV